MLPDAEYPHLSKAIQHFKDTKKGRDEMRAMIEEYANESAVEATIDTCIEHGDSKEETITYVLKKFPQMSEQHISERISELWDEK